MQAADPTTRPAAAPTTQPKLKAYPSLHKLLAGIPRELTKGSDEQFTPTQIASINKWFREKVTAGSAVAYAGQFDGFSGNKQRGLMVSFKHSKISIGRRKIVLRINAAVDGKYAGLVGMFTKGTRDRYVTVNRRRTLVSKGAPGSRVTVRGKISSMKLLGGELQVRLTRGDIDAGSSRIGATGRPRPTTRPATRPTTGRGPSAEALEKKARSKLKLASNYLRFGKKDVALKILAGIVADYPDTPSAKLAAQELNTLEGLK